MYVRTYVRIYVCMHVCMYVCMSPLDPTSRVLVGGRYVASWTPGGDEGARLPRYGCKLLKMAVNYPF